MSNRSIAPPSLPSNKDNGIVHFLRPAKSDLRRAWREESHVYDVGILLAKRFVKYEKDKEDDHSHRMMINGLTFVMLIALIAIGIWLAPSFP